MNNKEFHSIDEFKVFDTNYPEKGALIPKMVYDVPYDYNINEFLKLEWMILSFEQFENDQVSVKYSESTGEIFLADMNDGGHVPRCRLVKVNRSKFYNDQAEIIEWNINRGSKFWN